MGTGVRWVLRLARRSVPQEQSRRPAVASAMKAENRMMRQLTIGRSAESRMPLWMVVVPFMGVAGGFLLGYFAARIFGF